MMALALLLLLLAFPASTYGAQHIGGNIAFGGKPGSAAPTLLTDNLIAYYECEPGAIANDSHTNALHLTNNNGVIGSVEFSIVGDNCQFNFAASQSLSRADNSLFDVGTGDFAYSFWMRTSSGNIIVLSKGGASTSDPGYLFYIQTSGAFSVQVMSPTDGIGDTTLQTGFNDGAWHHIVVNHSRAGNLEIFADGVSIHTVNMPTYITGNADNATEFRIGRGSPIFGDFFYNQKLDQIGFWKRTLPLAQITALRNGGAGMTYAQLVAWTP